MVGCSFQRWPSSGWSTFSMITLETRAKKPHVVKSCYIWSIAIWRPWISNGVRWFHQLRGRSCGVPAGPIWEKQTSMRASSCKLGCDVWPVRLTKWFFSNVKAIITAVSLTTFGNIEHLATLKGQKSEVNSCKWSDLQKSLARGAATDCRPFILTVPFWALQVLWQGHQRCRWGRRPAGSLAELSPGEVELWVLLWISIHCVAEAAGCQLDQFERSKLHRVPRLANLVAMFGQFVWRSVFLEC